MKKKKNCVSFIYYCSRVILCSLHYYYHSLQYKVLSYTHWSRYVCWFVIQYMPATVSVHIWLSYCMLSYHLLSGRKGITIVFVKLCCYSAILALDQQTISINILFRTIDGVCFLCWKLLLFISTLLSLLPLLMGHHHLCLRRQKGPLIVQWPSGLSSRYRGFITLSRQLCSTLGRSQLLVFSSTKRHC